MPGAAPTPSRDERGQLDGRKAVTGDDIGAAPGDPERAEAGRLLAIADLTEHAGISYEAVRQHLGQMQLEGWIAPDVQRRLGALARGHRKGARQRPGPAEPSLAGLAAGDGYRRDRYGERLLAVPAVHRSGARLPLEFSVTLVRSEQGEVLGVAAVLRDVSERWHRGKELRERLARLEAGA